MEVIVPHILISSRFIVLPRRDSLTLIDVLEGKSDFFGNILNVMSIQWRQVIEILEMLIGNNEDMPFIVGPPPRGDKSCYRAILIHQILLAVLQVITAMKKDTKGTDIVVRCMVKQETPPW